MFAEIVCEKGQLFSTGRSLRQRSTKKITFLGNTYTNLEMIFSIDGLHDDTNGIYRKRVNTKRALDNMITFANTRPNKTYWQFLVFEHNFFEIPEVLELSEKYKIKVYIKINQRPKFKISNKRFDIAKKLYNDNKTNFSEFLLAN